jgi:phage shock protein A
MKKQIALIAMILLPLASGCGAVADAKAQVCTSLKGLSQNVTEVADSLKDGSTKLTVSDLKTKLKPVRDMLNTVKPVASAANADQLVTTLGAALDGVDKAMEGTADTVSLSTLTDKLAAPIEQVQQAYQGVNTAICPA